MPYKYQELHSMYKMIRFHIITIFDQMTIQILFQLMMINRIIGEKVQPTVVSELLYSFSRDFGQRGTYVEVWFSKLLNEKLNLKMFNKEHMLKLPNQYKIMMVLNKGAIVPATDYQKSIFCDQLDDPNYHL